MKLPINNVYGWYKQNLIELVHVLVGWVFIYLFIYKESTKARSSLSVKWKEVFKSAKTTPPSWRKEPLVIRTPQNPKGQYTKRALTFKKKWLFLPQVVNHICNAIMTHNNHSNQIVVSASCVYIYMLFNIIRLLLSAFQLCSPSHFLKAFWLKRKRKSVICSNFAVIS